MYRRVIFRHFFTKVKNCSGKFEDVQGGGGQNFGTPDDKGGRGVKNGPKFEDVVYVWPLINISHVYKHNIARL